MSASKGSDDLSGTAFVTGGTGFVGSHLVEELLRRGVSEIRCLVRSEPKWLDEIRAKAPDRITYVRGELSNIEMLWEALDGVDRVYHVGGRTRARTYDALQEANVKATMNLLGAVKHAAPNVDRVLVTSSLAAVGRCEADVATEDMPLQPVSRYGRSKAEMEQAIRSAHQMTESYADVLPITIVRPPAVYGPRDRDILQFFQSVQRHICPVAGPASKPAVSLVHVKDLARGMVDSAMHEDAEGETYFIGSERAYSWNDVKDAATSALDTWALTVPVPTPLVGAVGAASELFGRLTGDYPALNREKTKEIRHACTICSSDKAKREIGYHQQIDLADGVANTIDWYKDRGWL
ncbi:NAD-dependent epimerase [Longibacter salinarum]|uniref:NAD-dependent epimerase n=2 Tax=Longibacter salinarum TaxID=1850348 RepID=A0A2A8CUC4_9BACT|nr:NAD-dependent epimerase [Longibacter salinarum]